MNRALKISLLILICLVVKSVAMAQNPAPPVPKMPQGPFDDGHPKPYKPGTVKGPFNADPGEVGPAVDLTKLNIKDPSTPPKWKAPSWWVEGFAMAKNVVDGIRGVFGGNDKPESYDPAYRSYFHAPITDYDNRINFDSSSASRRNYFLSYGIGFGLGMRGTKFVSSNSKETDALLYLQLPILKVRLNYVLKGLSTVYAEGGAYYALALSGHYKDETGTHSLKLGNNANADDYRRGDWGLKFGVGYKFAYIPILIGLDGDFGLRNIAPGGNADSKTKNLAFALKVAYRLGFKSPR